MTVNFWNGPPSPAFTVDDLRAAEAYCDAIARRRPDEVLVDIARHVAKNEERAKDFLLREPLARR